MNFESVSSNRHVETVTTDPESILRDITESHEERLRSRGGHFTVKELIPVYFCAFLGFDSDDTYNNLLFFLKKNISESKKCLILKEGSFANPAPNEVSAFNGTDRSDKDKIVDGICSKISVRNDNIRTEAAREAFKNFLRNSDEPLGKLYNNGVTLGCFFNRIANAYASSGKAGEIPAVIFYGNIKPNELSLLHILSKSGMDVIYISPDKSQADMIKLGNVASRMQIFEFPNSKEIMPYPEKEVKAKVSTAAYNAERELDTVLYGADTCFRDFQFSDMETAVLKTTFDEIRIIWEEPARFRPGFAVKGQKVVIPTIFAKISGVQDGNIGRYWDYVRDLLTPDTIITVKSPSYKEPDEYAFREFAPYHDGHNLFIEKLKSSRDNRYSFLSDELQDLIFHKIQDAYDSNMLNIADDRQRMEYLILAGMTIDRNVLRLLQKYDFTKEIPKFIIIDSIEDTFSRIECAQILLFSMLGFDMLILTPTGYRNLETFIKPEAYEIHQQSGFEYNVKIPRFRIPEKYAAPKKNSGLFSNLFKKGRK